MITLSSGFITNPALISPVCGRSSLQGRTLKVAASAGPPIPMPSAKPPAAVSEVAMNWRREIGVDIGIGWIGIGLEIGNRRHDLAGLAIAALRHLFGEPGLLHRMPAVRREPLDGGDLGTVDGADRRDAGADRLAVDMHGAGAALRDPAAELGTG